MRKLTILCVVAMALAVSGSAMSISGECSTSFLFGPDTGFSTTTLALSTTHDSWGLSSTSVLTADGLYRQELGFSRDLGALSISGAVAFSPTPGEAAAFHHTDNGSRWKGSGLDLEAWNLSLELSLDRLTIGITITQR